MGYKNVKAGIYRSGRVLFKQIKYIYNIGNLNIVITTLNMQTALLCKKQNVLANNIARNENLQVT